MSARTSSSSSDDELARVVDSYDAYARHVADNLERYKQRNRLEHELAAQGEVFTIPGVCYPCNARVDLQVGHDHCYEVDGERVLNWRERLVCPRCRMNNRMRATLHVFEASLRPEPDSRIFITEQMSPIYRRLGERFSHVVGSEYQGNSVPFGATNEHGIRNENLNALTFADESFDCVVCLDVFEHIPDYPNAFRECLRVLAPGGRLLFSVPFIAQEPSNLVRATVAESGEVEHLMTPEYHSDPVDTSRGLLAYYTFGWKLLDDVRAVGFENVVAHLLWSEEFGYLGPEQVILSSTKGRGA